MPHCSGGMGVQLLSLPSGRAICGRLLCGRLLYLRSQRRRKFGVSHLPFFGTLTVLQKSSAHDVHALTRLPTPWRRRLASPSTLAGNSAAAATTATILAAVASISVLLAAARTSTAAATSRSDRLRMTDSIERHRDRWHPTRRRYPILRCCCVGNSQVATCEFGLSL
jgi:hypothetical protein